MANLERIDEIIRNHTFCLTADINGPELEEPFCVLSGDEELQEILSHVRSYNEQKREAWIVEIGTAFGGTAAMFAAWAARLGNLRVMTMAPHNRPEIPKALAGMEDICWFYNKVSQRAYWEWQDDCSVKGIEANIWFLFVDGNHTYEDVHAELDLYSSSIMQDGSILCHDAERAPGVKRAISEWLESHCLWERIQTGFPKHALLRRRQSNINLE